MNPNRRSTMRHVPARRSLLPRARANLLGDGDAWRASSRDAKRLVPDELKPRSKVVPRRAVHHRGRRDLSLIVDRVEPDDQRAAQRWPRQPALPDPQRAVVAEVWPTWRTLGLTNDGAEAVGLSTAALRPSRRRQRDRRPPGVHGDGVIKRRRKSFA